MGTVFNDVTGWPGLSGWVIELSGTVTATAVTDATGSYRFSGLPAGTYTICEVVQSGWRQTWPTPDRLLDRRGLHVRTRRRPER
jgi:hypothetical protein